MSCLNVCAIEGYVVGDVFLSTDEIKGIQKATFFIRNPSKKSKKNYSNEFYVVAYGKLAETCANYLKKDKRVAVSGSITTWVKYDDNGNKTSGVILNADDITWDKD